MSLNSPNIEASTNHGILRKGASEERNSKSKAKTIQWDEEVIAEHDKERGTRQHIEEPNTPYLYPAGSAELLEDSDAALSLGSRRSSDAVSYDSIRSRTDSASSLTNHNNNPRQGSDSKKSLPAPASEAKGEWAAICDEKGLEISGGVSPDALVARLNELRQRQDEIRGRPKQQERGYEASDFELEEMTKEEEKNLKLQKAEEEQKRRDFELKRRSHYNEFKVLQQMREKGKLEDEDSET